MYILGIETSCDETAAAIVEDGRIIHSNVIASSIKEHAKYGGVIPEIASRRQLEYIHPVVEEAIDQAGIDLNQIDAVAVTQKPGLIGSLIVGRSFAESLSFAIDKPLVYVDHIQAHVYASMLCLPTQMDQPSASLPLVGLVVSGGHTTLFLVKSFNDFEIIGQTRDDAVGEAYDKVARIMKLGYPGGPVIDRLAQKGDKSTIRFKCADLKGSLDFSFSGIKTSVLYYLRDNTETALNHQEDIAYAFQESVVKVITEKAIAACKQYNVNSLCLGGGVAANSRLRNELEIQSRNNHISFYMPSFNLCMDNAAMIAGLGYHLINEESYARP